MAIEMGCPWCEERIVADLASSDLCSITCAACRSAVDFIAEEELALPLAA